ncbi:hypothetical protein QDR37_03760 [Amnibacterium sp. CER49]|uniref:hypothetical protein n=1 Tax=Amnibacterium sp. CER49 TaxID=3039161 RepID=UPI00244BFEAA|nr:hypothetical protein [Amnibacterium sp. CER49]MDH2443057.1 hypothetical protein [Amnibacterium sp. CER49]
MTRTPSSRALSVTAATALTLTVGATVAAGLLLPAHPAHRTAAAPPAPTATSAPAHTTAPAPRTTTAPLPASTTAALATRTITTRSATAAVATYVQAVDSVTPDSLTGAITPVVAGQAKAELQAQQLEFESNGWTVHGTTRVDGVRVLGSDPASATPTARVQACIDSSDVTLLDAHGKPVVAHPQAVRRALNLYSLAYTDGTWHIVAHSFPADPSC